MRSLRAFTLVELLVVIVIIGILVALLIPAVQSARAAGRRISCANHLKQFALAVSNYSASHGNRLPPMVVEFFGASGSRPLPKGNWKCDAWVDTQSPGWRVAVLPFLEEQGLYDMFDLSTGVVTGRNHRAISQVLAIYQCPSTPGYPRTTVQTKRRETSRIPDDLTVGAWDYGIPVKAWQQRNENGEIEAFLPAWNGVKYPYGPGEHMGNSCAWELEYGRGAKLGWVTDGLSKTTLAYETANRPNVFNREGLDGTSSTDGEPMTGKTWPMSHGFGWAQIHPFRPYAHRPINSTNHDSRFSFHPGGVNEAFLDGSVRFLDESTDVRIVRDLVSRSGRFEAPNVSWAD